MIDANPLISIIVPIYNVEKYLERCIDSIINQTYKNLEIILVNDGSPDNSRLICQKYANIDNRIVYLEKTNGGLGSARNFGIERMHGAYCAFIDSDDYINESMIEILYNNMVSYDSDISICDSEIFYDDGNIIKKNNKEFTRVLSKTDALKLMFFPRKIRWAAWNKLYKSSLFNQVRYLEGYYSEDMATTYLLFDRCNKIVWTNKPLYYYFIRKDGIMKSKPSKRYSDEIEIIENICLFFENHYPELADYPKGFYGKIAINNLVGLVNKNENKPIQIKCYKAIKQYGGLALKQKYVRTKYKFIIFNFRFLLFFTSENVLEKKWFMRFCKKVSKHLK